MNKKIFEKLNIDNFLTSGFKKTNIQNKIKNNTALFEHFNYMADLLFLPTTKEGFKYLLVVVDIATNEFDFEPLKNKENSTVLDAFKTIFKRNILKKPKFSIRTDDGNEFKGDVKKYFFDNSILHRIAPAYSHKIPNVERLNRELGNIFNLYMNSIEKATGKQYNEWTDILTTVKNDLNKVRKLDKNKFTKMRELQFKILPDWNNLKTKFKVGDLVHHKLFFPLNALGEKQPTANFREGDIRYSIEPKKITELVFMADNPFIRYKISGMKNVSFSENELKLSQKQAIPKIKQLLDKKGIKPTKYLIWFENQPKKNAIWMTSSQLLKGGYDIDNL